MIARPPESCSEQRLQHRSSQAGADLRAGREPGHIRQLQHRLPTARNRQPLQLAPAIELKEANFKNYEAGGWVALFERKVYVDLSVYQMEGRNEIISLLQPDNSTQSQNVGATRHQGIEYTLTYAPVSEVNFRFSGTNARHTYLEYSEVVQGKNRDYTGNRMVNAPNWITNAEVYYKPRFAPGARVGPGIPARRLLLHQHG
ncbi:MAG: TonB-dependent receptor [Hymenobacter sp.]